MLLHQPTSVLDALGFYGHNVILPAVAGLHFGQQLTAALGIAAATALAAFAAAAVIACVLVREKRGKRPGVRRHHAGPQPVHSYPGVRARGCGQCRGEHGTPCGLQALATPRSRSCSSTHSSSSRSMPTCAAAACPSSAPRMARRSRRSSPFSASHGLATSGTQTCARTPPRGHRSVGRIERTCQQPPPQFGRHPASCAHTLLSGETLNTLWPAHICHTSHRPRHRNDQGSPGQAVLPLLGLAGWAIVGGFMTLDVVAGLAGRGDRDAFFHSDLVGWSRW